jgi:hypothetical protein
MATYGDYGHDMVTMDVTPWHIRPIGVRIPVSPLGSNCCKLLVLKGI